MSEVRIAAEPRTEFGKGAARRIRRAHRVPAVLRGHGGKPTHISLPGHDLMLALKNPNVLLSVELGGKRQLALPREVQRHPVRGHLEHVDLLLVRRGERVRVEVPLRLDGEVASGGLLDVTLPDLPIMAEATNIPTGIEMSIEGLAIGNSIYAGDIKLPPGAELDLDADRLVLHVVAARTAEQVEAELAEAEAEAGIAREVPEVEAAPARAEGEAEPESE